jgi:hypothetical protein
MGTVLGNSCLEDEERVQKINIKINCNEIDCDNMQWIELVKSTNRISWRILF